MSSRYSRALFIPVVIPAPIGLLLVRPVGARGKSCRLCGGGAGERADFFGNVDVVTHYGASGNAFLQCDNT
jgi:hypothetical protein